MANIKVALEYPLYDGMPITFNAPCECNAVNGLTVSYRNESKKFIFRDAHRNNLTGLGNLFSEGAYVKAILDVNNGYAYIQNADTNAYLEQKFRDHTLVATDPNGDGNIVMRYGGSVEGGGGSSTGGGTSGGGTGTGADGKDGEDGGYYTPDVTDGVLSWTPSKAGMPAVPSANVKGADGKTPVKGEDYFTEAEIQAIAEQAAGMVDVPGGGTGGVSSWNDLTDKPFGEDVICEWNKGAEYQETVQGTYGATFVKISDNAPEMASLLGKTIYLETTNGNASYPLDESKLEVQGDAMYAIFSMAVVVLYDFYDNENGVQFTKGIWYIDDNMFGGIINTMRITGGVKCLEEQYIPATIARVDEVQTMIDTALGVIANDAY